MATYTTNATTLVDPSVSYPDQFQTVVLNSGSFTGVTGILMVAPKNMVVDSVVVGSQHNGASSNDFVFALKAGGTVTSSGDVVATSATLSLSNGGIHVTTLKVAQSNALVKAGSSLFLTKTTNVTGADGGHWASVTISFRTRQA